MNKHTPGPWLLEQSEGDLAVTVWTGGRRCSLYEWPTNYCYQDVADARLISAAPDLLAALEGVLAFEDPDSLEDQQTDPRLRAERTEAWQRAKAALSKATGVQS